MIIAEIGQNWCGDISLAYKLIELAKENGADLAKFQLFDYEKTYPKHQIPKVELSFYQTQGVFEYGRKVGIEVFFSVFDVERVKWCEEIGVKRYKVASGKIEDRHLLRAVKRTRKDIVLSTPGYYVPHTTQYELYEYKQGMDCCYMSYRPSILFCENNYPASHLNIHWQAISFPGVFDGFSDHTIGLDAAKIALARGAQIIEKHFAIDHETGIDAKWSMDASELRELRRWADVCKQVI